MNPRITSIIPKQNFETVREQIGAILLIELENQKTLQGFSYPINVYSEYSGGIGIEDEVNINVSLSSSNFGGKTQKDAQGNTVFNIDIFSNAKETANKTGSEISAGRIGKFLGMIRFILSHTEYKTLGFELGFIGGTYFESFEFTEQNYFPQDGANVKMCRITFSARLQENQTMSPINILEGNETNVKLELTEKGYKYKFIN
ncbi:MAG: hypothetical protein [Caudoviricetes sp.]|nr:MAG: hypothetical protein [Caudoviricetes sp.]